MLYPGFPEGARKAVWRVKPLAKPSISNEL
jgi:hypothetical protein